jgi:hypothetical protein
MAMRVGLGKSISTYYALHLNLKSILTGFEKKTSHLFFVVVVVLKSIATRKPVSVYIQQFAES